MSTARRSGKKLIKAEQTAFFPSRSKIQVCRKGRRLFSTSINLTQFLNFYGFTFEKENFYRTYPINISYKFVKGQLESQGKSKNIFARAIKIGSKKNKKKKRKNRSGGTRPLKIPGLSRREATSATRWMLGFPVGRVDFIYRSINHYNFLSRPRKNVNGRARNQVRESLFLREGKP